MGAMIWAAELALVVLVGLVVASLLGSWLQYSRRVQLRHVEDIGLLDGPGADYYAVLIRDMETGQEWRIYEDGQIEGWEGRKVTVINRIPALVAAAGKLGYSESESLKIMPETSEKWFREAKLRGDYGRKQEG